VWPFGRRKITADTDLESLSDERLLKEHRRRVLAEPRSGADGVGAYGLASEIEDVLERRGVSFPSAEEILAEEGGGESGG
jgi:hypothetical protein